MDLALNNLQRLICHKTQTNQSFWLLLWCCKERKTCSIGNVQSSIQPYCTKIQVKTQSHETDEFYILTYILYIINNFKHCDMTVAIYYKLENKLKIDDRHFKVIAQTETCVFGFP